MMHSILVLLCLFTLACGEKTTIDGKIPLNDMRPIVEKLNVYTKLAKIHTDSYQGFSDYGCDSLLFSGLYKATGSATNLTIARDADGAWHRRPLSEPECYPNDSGSTISRDMFIGLFYAIWRTKDLKMAEAIAEYGEAHNWIMGEGDASRVYLSPQMISTLYRMIYKLGGKRQKSKESFDIQTEKLKGYQAHLLVLHCLLRGEIDGTASEACVAVFKYQADRQNNNALFQAAYHLYSDGDQSTAIGLLMDEKHWPADRLPSGKEHCEPYLWQRDEGKDWEPCEVGEHSGIDWIFAANVLMYKAD